MAKKHQKQPNKKKSSKQARATSSSDAASKKSAPHRVNLPPPIEDNSALPGIPMSTPPLFESNLAKTATTDRTPYRPSSEGPTFLGIFLKATGLALLFAFIMLLVTALAVGGYAYSQVRKFSQASQTPISELRTTVEEGLAATPTNTNGRKNVLLLGTDTLATRGDIPPLTDTMILVSIDLKSGKIYTISFPRDIWSVEYQTKINSLYSYGIEKYPDEPERFPREVIEQMTGVPIHHTVVLSMNTVAAVIDAVGGIEVDVPQGFTDPMFPRTDVDVTVERDPAKLYETITFETGPQTMNGEQVLKYVRSRHSEGDTGTDISRGQRQQQVIEALMKRVMNREVLANPEVAGTLYLFYTQTFGSVFPVTELLATGKALYPYRDSISQHSHTLSIYPEDAAGVLVNPPIPKYKVWVYEVRDAEKFKQEVATDLGIK